MFVAATKVACANLQYNVCAVLVVDGDASLSGVVHAVSELTTFVEGLHGGTAERTKTHGGDINNGSWAECFGTITRGTHHLSAWCRMERIVVGVILGDFQLWESGLFEDEVVGSELDIVVGTKAEVAVFFF